MRELEAMQLEERAEGGQRARLFEGGQGGLETCYMLLWMLADKLELKRSRLGCSHDADGGEGEGKRRADETRRTKLTIGSTNALLST